MKRIENKTFDEERALYNLKDSTIYHCTFKGPKDGESALKESRNIIVDNCLFALRYPLWHVKKYELKDSLMEDTTRAPLWYCQDGVIKNCHLYGVKMLRECDNTTIDNCEIISPEFGWWTRDSKIKDSKITSEYIFLNSRNIKWENIHFTGKYSFQYCENVVIRNSILDTKDAFWHAKDVTVYDSIIKGEYLAWFSKNLTLINCKIIGTQPLCYCENLKLINCETEDCDLAFEYSSVDADINGHIISIKNPKEGIIKVDSVDEIINEDAVMEINGQVIIKNKQLTQLS